MIGQQLKDFAARIDSTAEIKVQLYGYGAAYDDFVLQAVLCTSRLETKSEAKLPLPEAPRMVTEIIEDAPLNEPESPR